MIKYTLKITALTFLSLLIAVLKVTRHVAGFIEKLAFKPFDKLYATIHTPSPQTAPKSPEFAPSGVDIERLARESLNKDYTLADIQSAHGVSYRQARKIKDFQERIQNEPAIQDFTL